MSPAPRLLAALVLTLIAAAGCGKPFSLAGRWEGNDAENGKQIFIFEPGGTCRWVLEYGPQSKTFDVTYAFDGTKAPAQLTLSGFTEGPLANLSLFCIVDRPDSTALRLECRPGNPAPPSPGLFPKGFGRQAVVVRKVS